MLAIYSASLNCTTSPTSNAYESISEEGMAADNSRDHIALPIRILTFVRAKKRGVLLTLVAIGLPLALAAGCTATGSNSGSNSQNPPSSTATAAASPPGYQTVALASASQPPAAPVAFWQPASVQPLPAPGPPEPVTVAAPYGQVLSIDLPTALRLTNANNPTIALARERVEEAYAAERQADVAWLPNLQAGPNYERHDGRDQTTQGPIIEVSKQNLYVNGGAVLYWNSADILFGPLVAARLVEAQSAAAQTSDNDVQLSAADAYLDLLQYNAALAINADTLNRTKVMLDNASAADQAGLTKTAADINRAQAEYQARREERIQLEGSVEVASARLAQLLLLRPTVLLTPADQQVVPIMLVSENANPDELVTTALSNRPEIMEGRAISAAAMTRLRQARLAPLLPHFDVSYYGGTFGGGVDSQMSDFGGRSDGEVDIYWELHNLGLGDIAQARIREAQLNETSFRLAEIRAEVGAQVTSAYRQVMAGRQSLTSAQQSVLQSLETWRRLRVASFGLAGQQHLYDPLEPLIAERDLNQARTTYLNAVIGYNRAQFQLFWALGQPPLHAPAEAQRIAVAVPVVPEPAAEEVPPRPVKPPALPGAR
jgi:outer membrane protein TolC